MKRYLFFSFVLLHVCKQVYAVHNANQHDDEKITYVQIKPLTDQSTLSVIPILDMSRSAKIEGSPVYSLTINKLSAGRFRRSDDDSEKTTDDDENHESEYRFDTSEAILPDVEDSVDNEQQSHLETEIGAENDFIKPNIYNKNNIGSLLKPRFPTKKYYSNLDVNPGYRKYLEMRQFRSRCRCERIWNCPKLQITVPRCPDEYFLCCF
ncbi:uncharacterized protein LOC143922851 [Arctopsyche grandis]|uniref:uncharacterized protein LOC143922851 n=1 Tax=Arctopsyche grandis TaxID=121162 RepID=UPI00406DA2F5